MWVLLLSKLVLWFLKLRYVMPYLQYMLPVVLFIICGNRARVIMLLLFVTLAYDISAGRETNRVFVLSIIVTSVLREPPMGDY